MSGIPETVAWKWKDISTAPDKGCLLGLINSGHHTETIVSLFVGYHHGEKRFYDCDALDSGTYIRHHPTHWFPYPTHPKTPRRSDSEINPALDLEDEIDRLEAEKAELLDALRHTDAMLKTMMERHSDWRSIEDMPKYMAGNELFEFFMPGTDDDKNPDTWRTATWDDRPENATMWCAIRCPLGPLDWEDKATGIIAKHRENG